jgi:hypothetical protein
MNNFNVTQDLHASLEGLANSQRWPRILRWYDVHSPSSEDVHAILSRWWTGCHKPALEGNRVIELFEHTSRHGIVKDDAAIQNIRGEITVYRGSCCNDLDVRGVSWSEDRTVAARFAQLRTCEIQHAVHSTVISSGQVLGRFNRCNEPFYDNEFEVIIRLDLRQVIVCEPPLQLNPDVRPIGRRLPWTACR